MSKWAVLVYGLIGTSSLWARSAPGQPGDSARSRVYTSPLQLIDVFSRPMFTLGTEYRLTNEWGLSVEGGIKIRDIAPADTAWVASEGYSARIEAKWYMGYRIGVNRNFYLSAEYRWILDRSNYSLTYYIEPEEMPADTMIYFDDDFGVIQHVQVANLKLGKLVPMGRHLYMDVYAGFGFRWRDVRNTHREFTGDSDQELMTHHPGSWMGKVEGKGMDGRIANLSLGFKFGWRF